MSKYILNCVININGGLYAELVHYFKCCQILYYYYLGIISDINVEGYTTFWNIVGMGKKALLFAKHSL